MNKKEAKQIASLINKMMVSRMMWDQKQKEGNTKRANDWYLSEQEAIAELFAMGIPMINGKSATDYIEFLQTGQLPA